MGGGSSEPWVPVFHSPPPQSALLTQNGTGSLPRNLAATLQDIETKRQLALQQKGEWLQDQPPCSPWGALDICPPPTPPLSQGVFALMEF